MKISLKIILALCSLGCLTGFPWAFLPWEITEHIINMQNAIPIGNAGFTILSYRFHCLLFGAFAFYFFILLYRSAKYAKLINIAAYLLIVMGVYMHWLKLRSGLLNTASHWEPVIWALIGGLILLFNRKTYTTAKKVKHSTSNDRRGQLCLKAIACLLASSLIWIFLPYSSRMAILHQFTLPVNTLHAHEQYTMGLIAGFLGFSSIIIWIISTKTNHYSELYKLILGVFICVPFILSIWLIQLELNSVILYLLLIFFELTGIGLAISHYKNRQLDTSRSFSHLK
ncbi:hypothetical protein DMA11_11745 [Marinilabiliaceae bacterium JC017]|nr:hypothetical protein DMA11_11745 [Marinilabiliaceae bacterium JC017]